MCKVVISVQCVWFLIFLVFGFVAVLLNSPSLHSGLISAADFDWFHGCSELNKQSQIGKQQWKPAYRLYSSLDFSKQKTYKLSNEDILNKHFSHVFETIEEERLAAQLSDYIAKHDSKVIRNPPINEIDPPSESAFYDGRWRNFLSRMHESLSDTAKLKRSVFDNLLNLPDTDHFVTEMKGLRMHFSLTQFPQSKVNGNSKPSLGVLLLNGWPSNANEWSGMLKTMKESDEIDDCSVYPVFVTVSLPSMGSSLSEVAARETFGDFNLMSLASMMRELMEVTLSHLFEEYIVIGTDWGALVTEFMAISHDSQSQLSMQYNKQPRKLRGILLGMPVSQAPLLEAILMQLSPMFTDYFLQDEPESIQELYRLRGKQGPFLMMFGRLWNGAQYQHWMNTRPHTATHVLSAHLASYSAFIFEKYMIWSSIANSTDQKTQNYLFDQIISTAVLAYTHPGGIEGGVGYYRENIVNYLMKGARVMTPPSIPVYAGVMGMDPFGKTTADRYLNLRYPGLRRVFRHPTVGHFPSMDDPNAIVRDVFQTLEDVSRNFIKEPVGSSSSSFLKSEV